MFSGLSIDTLGKCSAIIIAFVGALVYGSNQFISIVTTKPLDKQLKDPFTQARLNLWFYVIGIICGAIVYLLYAIILYQAIGKYYKHSFFIWNAFVWFILFIYFTITSIRAKKLQNIRNKSLHFKILVFNVITSIIFFFSSSSEYLNKGEYFSYLWNGIPLALLLSCLYFFMLNKIKVATTQQISYDIQPINEDDFKKVKDLKYEYSMDEKRLVFVPRKQSKKQIRYVCDFSSKVYLKCTEQINS
ncbi:hypothetical protein [Bacillus sp. BPN334]|uniref:hypothetical protein n=1 Tax=Bacillus sp. BPN334 TaxID=2217815 RepID=UPI0011F0280E|nr:hypothetical protein [Bacillus sp. BPN334]KAA0780492.1 hypothetical protein DN393_31140 [Bacillus sp. BPN334]KAA0780793.1 hypothetical protein DN393_30815 [Bacillus sp. BPN334]